MFKNKKPEKVCILAWYCLYPTGPQLPTRHCQPWVWQLCKQTKEHTSPKYGSLWSHSWSWLCIRTVLTPRLALGKDSHVLLDKGKFFFLSWNLSGINYMLIFYISVIFLRPEINLKERKKECTPFISHIHPEEKMQSVITPLCKY